MNGTGQFLEFRPTPNTFQKFFRPKQVKIRYGNHFWQELLGWAFSIQYLARTGITQYPVEENSWREAQVAFPLLIRFSNVLPICPRLSSIRPPHYWNPGFTRAKSWGAGLHLFLDLLSPMQLSVVEKVLGLSSNGIYSSSPPPTKGHIGSVLRGRGKAPRRANTTLNTRRDQRKGTSGIPTRDVKRQSWGCRL